MKHYLRGLARILVAAAVICNFGLLARDLGTEPLSRVSQSVVSATSLLLIGAAFLIAQPTIRQRTMELLRNIILACAFILWGFVQLLPPRAIANTLANIVITLYVLDLAWMIVAKFKSDTQS